jgi:membrane protease YdiL (CAAX protease family)
MQLSAKQKIFFYGGIIPGLVLNLIGSFFYFVLYADSAIVQAMYAGTKGIMLIWPVAWLIYIRKLPEFGVIPNRFFSILLGLLSGVAIVGTGLLLFWQFFDFFAGFESEIREKITAMGIEQNYIAFAFGISILHSLFEQFYWRIFVFRGLLLKFSLPVAAVLSSFFFASHHFVVLAEYFPWWLTLLLGTATGVGGYIWCILYAKTGSIVGSWLSHLMVDSGIFAIGYYIVFL